MNLRLPLLAVSLLANAALLVAYVAAPTGSRRPAASRLDTPASIAPSSSIVKDGASIVAGKPAPSDAASAGFSWATIETDDLDELMHRLKAAGFTPAEIRAILGHQINRMAQPTTPGATQSTPYWRTGRTDPADAKAHEEQRKRIAETMRLQRKYLLGPDSFVDNPERLEAARRRWGPLPLEKLQALEAIDADYQDLQMKQYAERSLRPGEESGTAEASRLMQKERLADMEKVLTPEEYAVFELRASDPANALRYRLQGFQPTEQEYKTLFAIQKAYENRLYDPNLGLDARRALLDEMSAQVKDALGADRALDYEAVTKHNNQDQTAVLVSRLGLPARVAVEVRQTQQDFTQRAKDLRSDTSLSAGERNARLAALARDAEVQLTTKLGADGFEAYSDIKGEWLRNLQAKSGKP